MRDLYWRYVTQGVVDIIDSYQTLPNISASCASRPASDQGQSLPVVVEDQAEIRFANGSRIIGTATPGSKLQDETSGEEPWHCDRCGTDVYPASAGRTHRCTAEDLERARRERGHG